MVEYNVDVYDWVDGVRRMTNSEWFGWRMVLTACTARRGDVDDAVDVVAGLACAAEDRALTLAGMGRPLVDVRDYAIREKLYDHAIGGAVPLLTR